MVPVELAKIIIDDKNNEQAVVLREKGGSRYVPIVIGLFEAESIQLKISGVDVPRPLTHDLLVSVLHSLEATADAVVIDDLKDETFFAKLHLKNKAGQVIVIDCRPSDGIAIAVRLRIPIFVEDKVLQQTSSQNI